MACIVSYKHHLCVVQSWSSGGQLLRSHAQQKADAQKAAESEQWLQEGQSKEEVKATDEPVEKAIAPIAPTSKDPEIKGFLSLAYPDLKSVAATACDAWLKGHTQVCSPWLRTLYAAHFAFHNKTCRTYLPHISM